ncbi:MAG: alpha/beta hydrolase [Clostridiaceae bacterium]|nr:alpha/beta hydrolase [Clostridiaceae bacterium]
MKLALNGYSINYSDSGTGGETILFLHGWGAPITAYRTVLSSLEQRYRVVAFDMPGVGGSSEPPVPLTIDDYIFLAENFAQAVGIKKCILVCHSHGGRVAIGLMSKRDCPVSITKAVFIDAAGVPPKRSVGYSLRLGLYKALRVLGTNKITAPLFGEVYEVQREKRSSADYKAASPVMRKTLSNVVSADMTPYMPNISVPVLLVWGEKDTATPLCDAKIMESLIPGSGLAIIKGGSHFPFVENYPQFDAVMRAFLPGGDGK